MPTITGLLLWVETSVCLKSTCTAAHFALADNQLTLVWLSSCTESHLQIKNSVIAKSALMLLTASSHEWASLCTVISYLTYVQLKQ